jgi:ribonuclease I
MMGVNDDISHFFALMKYILDNIDDGQISVMAFFGKKISNTLIFARLSHKAVQFPLKYVQVICVVDIVGNAFIKLNSRLVFSRSKQQMIL